MDNLGFYINLPIGGLSALFIVLFFKTPKNVKPAVATPKEKFLQLDPVGTILLMGTVVAYIMALQYGGQTKPWNSSVVIGLIVGFVAMIMALAIWEHFQGERAAFPPRLMSSRNVLVNALYTLFFAGSYFATVYYLPIYFQSVQNVSPIASGVRNLALIFAVLIALVGSGGFITKTGIATPLMVVGGAIATIAAGLLYTLNIKTATGKWVGYQILGGFGWGLSFMTPVTTTQAMVDPSDIPSATAIVLCKFLQTFLNSAQPAHSNIRLPNPWWLHLCSSRTICLRQHTHPQAGHERTRRQSSAGSSHRGYPIAIRLHA